MLIIKNANVILENEIKRLDILINGEKIESTGESINYESAEVFDADGCFVSAGFIDLHVHGGGGYSFMGNESDILNAAKAHGKYGVTSILPTALAADFGTLENMCQNVSNAQKQNPGILGVHLEGPFLSEKMCGAQSKDFLAVPSQTDYKEFLEKYKFLIKMMGVAPELDGATELGSSLKDMGIVASIAHSAGDYGTAVKALENGFSDITHIYNACTSCYKKDGLRCAGTVEAGLVNDGFTVQAIADLKHLPIGILKLIYKAKGADRMYLISDGLEFSAMKIENGAVVTQKNGVKAVFKDGAMFTADSKALAGGAGSGIELVKNMHKAVGVSLTDAVKMMTLTPAKVIGVDSHKGKISAGYDADIVVFDSEFNIKSIFALGKRI